MAIQKVYRIGVDVGGTNTDCVILREFFCYPITGKASGD